MFGTGGPPMVIYVLLTDIDRRIITSIYPLALGFGSGSVLIIDLLWIQHGFNYKFWPNYLSLFIGSLLGIIIGNIINKKIDQKTFRLTLQFALFCGSINLMIFGVNINGTDISLIGSFIECGLFVILVIVVAVRIICYPAVLPPSPKKIMSSRISSRSSTSVQRDV